jgi:A/G-specific adenine glycosylase
VVRTKRAFCLGLAGVLRLLCRVDSPLAAAAPAFRAALLAWYRVHQRDLPWRRQPSLYLTVVSEFMLQQTQVKTVLPYLARWRAALPDFAALAAASEAQVLKLWEGLGYYSRARNLHRLAQAWSAAVRKPVTPEEWRALPGIGPYTAAAITSISFGAQVAVVDGNVVRILARLTADATPWRDSTSAAKAFAPLAGALLNTAAPGDHNQAMMELGATLCHRRAPLCAGCPVRAWCAGHAGGSPENFPRLAAKAIEQITVVRAWCLRAARGARPAALLLHRIDPAARRLAGQHELPSAEQLGLLPAALARRHLLATKKRGITRFAFTEPIHALAPDALGDRLAPELCWVPLKQLDTVQMSGPHRRWTRELLACAGDGAQSVSS